MVPKVVFFCRVYSGVLKFINFFENFKFSNLQQVGDFFFLGLKVNFCHFSTKDFKKNFEFDVKSPFFLFFSEFSRKSSFSGGGGGIKFEFF